jgi:LPS-assembly protein
VQIRTILPFLAVIFYLSSVSLSWGADSLVKERDSAAPKKTSTPFSARTFQGPIEIEADRLEYDQEKDLYQAFGNVIITFKAGFLIADRASVNRSTGDAEAVGNVFVSDEEDTLEGDQIRFNLNTKTGITYNGKAFLSENNVYLTGKVIEKRGEQTYFVKDATATTCNDDQPAWRFTGRELDVTLEGYGTIKEGTFQVKNFPVIYAPYMIFPAKTKRQSGIIIPSLNYSDLNGFDLEVPFFWAISEDADATIYERYMDKRGWKHGLEYRYFLDKNTFGTFYGDYLNDTKEILGSEDGLFRDWKDNHHRWSYYLNNQTTFSPGFYLRTDLVKVSDHWYFRDFSNYNYYLQNYSPTGMPNFHRISFLGDRSLATLDSAARIVKDWPLYNLTVLARYTDNLAALTNDSTLQYYPQVTFTGIRRPIGGTGLNFELASSYINAYRNEGQKGQVWDINPTFSLPLSFGDYLQLTPSIGVNETIWEARGGSEHNNSSRDSYTLGLYGTSEIHKIFTVDIGNVDKIRHGIRPEITYAYRPNYSKNLPDFVSALPEMNAVTYALTNTLTTRSKEGSGFRYVELVRFKLSQTYNITEIRRSDPETDRRRLSPIDIEADILPPKFFSMRTLMRFDPNDGEWKKLNYDIAVSDDRGDSASIGYRYTQDVLEEINLGLKAKVNRNIDLLYMLRQNLFDKKTLESTVGIDYRQQCWSALLSYSELDNDRRIMLTFTLLGLGKVGSLEAKPTQLMGRTNNSAE